MGNCCLFMVLILSQTIPDWSTREILLSYCKNSITYNRNEVKIRNQERLWRQNLDQGKMDTFSKWTPRTGPYYSPVISFDSPQGKDLSKRE